MCEHVLRKLEIATGGKHHLNLIPYERESLRIIENGSFQDGAVGDANDAPVVQVLADPIPCFQQSGAEETYVDHVASGIADLYPVADRVELRKADRESTGDAGQHVLQGACDSRADQTQGEAQPAQTVFKKKREKEQDRK